MTPSAHQAGPRLQHRPRGLAGSGRGGGGGGDGHGGPSRRVRISKAMSWLLRHGAHKEGIAISDQGYVNVGDLLEWHKMSRELQVSFEEVLEEVRSNEKRRFALLHLPPPEAGASTQQTTAGRGSEASTMPAGGRDPAPAEGLGEIQSEVKEEEGEEEGEGEEEEEAAAAAASATTATAKALSRALSQPSPNPAHFFIRATQGHSLRTVSASAYLSPIRLESPSSIPDTVVHGTYYGAWNGILRTGGLKPMTRVHVHFATRPRLVSVLDRDGHGRGAAGGAAGSAAVETDESAVISGMRSDAQILIYVNIRKALEMGVPFWRSENGVVLSEGLGEDGRDQGRKGIKVVPTECWEAAVEVKEGLGVLWRDGALVRDLPDRLKREGRPHRMQSKDGADVRADQNLGHRPGKGNNKRRARGGGGKPTLTVEREQDVFSKRDG